jgi:hypothetical protein
MRGNACGRQLRQNQLAVGYHFFNFRAVYAANDFFG